MSVNVRIKLTRKNAKLPTLGSDGAAGYDLYAALEKSAYIPPGRKALIPTGLEMAIPEGMAGLIWSRSGLAVKCDVERGAGVIDEDYRGEVKVVLRNFGTDGVTIEPGDRIAQILFQKVEKPLMIEVDDLPPTKRAKKGFGSTGTK